MEFSKETTSKIEDLQVLEKNLQNLLMEKQSFQVELNESNNALEELTKSSKEVYKIIGGVMILSEKNNLISELNEKKKILELRFNSIEKQEKIFSEKVEKIRKEIDKEISDYNKKSK